MDGLEACVVNLLWGSDSFAQHCGQNVVQSADKLLVVMLCFGPLLSGDWSTNAALICLRRKIGRVLRRVDLRSYTEGCCLWSSSKGAVNRFERLSWDWISRKLIARMTATIAVVSANDTIFKSVIACMGPLPAHRPSRLCFV